MSRIREDYPAFLSRLGTYERLEPVPKSRGPEKLAGVRMLAGELGHPEREYRVVHVAGTNGKGLTSAMISRLLARAGRSVGLYASPHVSDIRERICIGNHLIGEGAFAASGHRVLDLADRRRDTIHFSYFDLLTLIALDAFREANVEWAVLETGLGGASDATNITPKELSVLTRIGLDHQHVLGNTIEEIAAEKLGIVPAGGPAVVADQPEGLGTWLHERLSAQQSPVFHASELVLEHAPGEAVPLVTRWPDGASFAITPPGGAWNITRPKLDCAATALVAAERLLGGTEGAQRSGRLRTALETTLPGRLEVRRGVRPAEYSGAPLEFVILDGGHNPGALEALCSQLKVWGIDRYALMISLQKDKLVPPLRAPLRRLLGGASRVLVLAPQTPRAPEAGVLESFIGELRPETNPAIMRESTPTESMATEPIPIETIANTHEGLLKLASRPREPAVITGSFWMLGDVLRDLEEGDAEISAG